MRTVTVTQPLYLGGWAGSVSKSLRSHVHVIFDTPQLPDKGFEQRNYCGGTLLTVPCTNKRAPIKDVTIDETTNWRRKHLKTIQQHYGKSPHWEKYEDWLQTVYLTRPWAYLVELNGLYLHKVLWELRAGCDVRKASDLLVDPSLTGPARVVAILRAVKAERFLVGEGARPYTPVERLKELGIEVVFESYPQFAPKTSMLDLLLTHGGEKTRDLMLNPNWAETKLLGGVFG